MYLYRVSHLNRRLRIPLIINYDTGKRSEGKLNSFEEAAILCRFFSSR